MTSVSKTMHDTFIANVIETGSAKISFFSHGLFGIPAVENVHPADFEIMLRNAPTLAIERVDRTSNGPSKVRQVTNKIHLNIAICLTTNRQVGDPPDHCAIFFFFLLSDKKWPLCTRISCRKDVKLHRGAAGSDLADVPAEYHTCDCSRGVPGRPGRDCEAERIGREVRQTRVETLLIGSIRKVALTRENSPFPSSFYLGGLNYKARSLEKGLLRSAPGFASEDGILDKILRSNAAFPAGSRRYEIEIRRKAVDLNEDHPDREKIDEANEAFASAQWLSAGFVHRRCLLELRRDSLQVKESHRLTVILIMSK